MVTNSKSNGEDKKQAQSSNMAVFNEIKELEKTISELGDKLNNFVFIIKDMLEEAGAGGLTKRARYNALDKLKEIDLD